MVTNPIRDHSCANDNSCWTARGGAVSQVMGNKDQACPVKAKGKARWAPGQSGNPRGTRTGSKHKATLFAESLLSGEAEGLVRKVIELAKAGDVGALKICRDRL